MSIDGSGNEADGRSYYHSISGNGRYVAFTTESPRIAGRGGGTVILRDLQTGSNTVIAGGFAPSIDRDGRFITFSSGEVLTDGDTPDRGDIFLYDIASASINILSSGLSGVFSIISDDGQSVTNDPQWMPQ